MEWRVDSRLSVCEGQGSAGAPLRSCLRWVALVVAVALAGCDVQSPSVLLHAVGQRFPFYACVPLGWVPIPTADKSYMIGYSAQTDDSSWYLPAKWVANIDRGSTKRPDVKAEFDLLTHLVDAGALQMSVTGDRFTFHLTWNSLQYYYDDDEFGNNPLHEPFLCQSRIVPGSILWREPVRSETVGGVERNVFRAAFSWSRGSSASWANDPFVASHSVILAPFKEPIVVRFVQDSDGSWEMDQLNDAGMPRIDFADRSAWPRSAP